MKPYISYIEKIRYWIAMLQSIVASSYMIALMCLSPRPGPFGSRRLSIGYYKCQLQLIIPLRPKGLFIHHPLLVRSTITLCLAKLFFALMSCYSIIPNTGTIISSQTSPGLSDHEACAVVIKFTGWTCLPKKSSRKIHLYNKANWDETD